MTSYSTIKHIAKEHGLKVSDLLALAPKNDPFYTGTKTDKMQAAWFKDVWRQAGYVSGVHLRRVHYWCVSQGSLLMHNNEPYENTNKCWGYLTQAAKMARYLGLIHIADIVDNKNPDPVRNAVYRPEPTGFYIETPKIDDPFVWVTGRGITDAQPYHLEVWCEKSTMNDVLAPICEEFNSNLATFEGEVSVTACYSLVQRIIEANKPARIFYISDFDPAGNNMPVATARKVEFILARLGCKLDVRLTPLVLTLDQVQEYRLPRTPIKETEKRAASFEEAFGFGAVELDALEALHPGILSDIVTAALEEYWDDDAYLEAHQAQQAIRQAVSAKVREIVDRYSPEIEALDYMIQELEAISIDTDDYQVPTHAPHVDDEHWLFESGRDYVSQIIEYKKHRGLASSAEEIE